MKKLIAAGAAAVFVTLACAPSGTRGSAQASDTGRALRLIPMDSAQAERLCLKPDLVRAGLAECVLKDQSPAFTPLRREPPPPLLPSTAR